MSTDEPHTPKDPKREKAERKAKMYADLLQDLARVLRQAYGKNVMMATLHFELATISANVMALVRTLKAEGLIDEDLMQTYSIEVLEELVQKFAERLDVPKDVYRTKGKDGNPNA